MRSLFGEPRELLPIDGSAVFHEQFFDPELAESAFEDLYRTIPWKSHDIIVHGQKHTEPRLSSWHADEGLCYTYSNVERVPLAWTPLLIELCGLCQQASGSTFNSVLVNLYRDGNDAMGWHADDEIENGPEPTIASLSLGAPRRFDFQHRFTKQVECIQLQGGDLVVMSGRSQSHWLHRIAKTKKPVGPRINLTFRMVGQPRR
jgi:alkylated DNA repair dioxygenase AlkB